MAEIKVEPKQGMGWIWVVLVLVVLAIAAWFLFARTGADVAPAPAADTIGVAPLPAAPVLI